MLYDAFEPKKPKWVSAGVILLWWAWAQFTYYLLSTSTVIQHLPPALLHYKYIFNIHLYKVPSIYTLHIDILI